ncbi:MAG: RidA family protein [Desulfobacterales bacterium]|nr:RidA family protein [Desulfobacterales bacterium]
MKKELVQPNLLEVPKGPYSQAIKVTRDTLLFISGQTPLDSEGRLVGKGDPSAQTRQVMENLSCVLEAAGGKLDDIVKTTVYITHLDHFKRVSDVRKEYLGSPYPASTLLVVNSLYLKEILVEIDAIAVLK